MGRIRSTHSWTFFVCSTSIRKGDAPNSFRMKSMAIPLHDQAGTHGEKSLRILTANDPGIKPKLVLMRINRAQLVVEAPVVVGMFDVPGGRVAADGGGHGVAHVTGNKEQDRLVVVTEIVRVPFEDL